MEALRTHGARARASGNLRGMVPGCTFKLLRHPRQQANSEYLILDTILLIEDVPLDSQLAAGRGWTVTVDLTAHPVREPLRPAATRSKPSAGPQVARVVGPAGQNIWTDYLGRIKVQFPWDRLGTHDQRSSCWVRVSSPWAGNQLGGIHIPRIGQEVLIEFLGNDPDLPVCTARLNNQNNQPPWALPGQSALSGYRSRELSPEGGGNSAAGRSNHLVMDDTVNEIQLQAASEHLWTSLSMGSITRIEDNAGRKDARGEGLELRTDGHAAFRSMRGTLITTYGRERARAHVKDMGEAVHRFTEARDQHETLASLGQQHHIQDAKEDQESVSEALRKVNDEIKGDERAAPGTFPELARPHLVLASAAAIAATAASDLHLASGGHLAITSGGHTSVSSGKSLLASAMEAIRLFAYNTGIRIFAAKGAVQVQAQDDMIELVAKKAIELISSTDWIRLKAKKGISFEADESAFQIDAKGFQCFTPAAHHVWARDHQTFGPKALKPLLPDLPTSVCVPCMLRAARSGSAIAKI
jgi:type VI secretion system secreted protein VgrG